MKSVQKVEAKKAFVLNLNDEVCMFQCASRADMDDWYRDVQKYLVSGQPSNAVVHPTSTEEEIYESKCSFDEYKNSHYYKHSVVCVFFTTHSCS